MLERTCESWEAFQRRLDDYFKKSAWERERYVFRGQADSKWPLVSTLDRFLTNLHKANRDEVEKQLLGLFGRNVRGMVPAIADLPDAQVRLMARHHGLPSSIMDWTRSPYVAAFFAFADSVLLRKNAPEEVAIWVIDTDKILDPRVQESVLETVDDQDALAITPRAIEQQSAFLRVIAPKLNIETEFGNALRKFVLPSSLRDEVLVRLEKMRIDPVMLFRSPDAAAEAAVWKVRILHQGEHA